MSKNAMSSAVQSSGWSGVVASPLLKDAALVVGGSLLMAVCAHVSVPLVFSPVPITLQTFGVLLIALTLGSKRGFAALTVYLIEGASGLPVFSPAGLGGVAQILGPTGGFLIAYPLVAFICGYIFEKNAPRKVLSGAFGAALFAALVAEVVLFSSGMAWLKIFAGISFARAAALAILPFIPGEVLKAAAAAAIASRFNRKSASHTAQQ
jgi:biotin transport system substrate-specific component